jgi:hypothetical protein
MDQQTIFAQQNAEGLLRSLQAPQTDPTSINMTLPRKADRANKYLAFDADGNPQPGDTAVEVAAIAGIATEIQAVAAIDTEVTTVAGIDTEITSVASNATNINTVAGISSNVTTVAGMSSNISTVVANITDIQNADDNATAAQAAQAAAEAARDATLAAYDSFDDRYLGAKSSNPSVDNDGNALVAGSLYYNTVAPEMRVYTGSAWVAAYVSGTGFLAAASNLSDLASAATALTNLGGTTAGKAVFTAASVAAAQQAIDVEVGVDVQAYDVDTAKTDVAQSFTKAQRGSIVALTDGATITPDFSLANNYSVTLGGSRTLANPTNITAGQSGVITITQDGTGSRTLAYGSYFKFAAGTAPTLTTTASAVDVLAYYVESSTRITARLIGDVK